MLRHYYFFMSILMTTVFICDDIPAKDVNMAEVQKIAKLSVDQMLEGVPVPS